METIETDVLVIGSGAAGLRATIEVNEHRVHATVVTKGLAARSGCTQGALYCSGVGPWHLPEDSTELHFKDTVIGGGFLCNQKLAKILTDEAPDRLIELEQWGMYWERKPDGSLQILRSEGHSIPRTIHCNVRGSGLELVKILKLEAMRRDIDIFEETMVTNLLTRGNTVVGATALNYVSGNFLVFRAKATVLASGGGSQIYPVTHVSREQTGDGHAMAYRAGAEMIDMEQTMWIGTCFAYPRAWASSGVPVQFEVEGYSPRLYNSLGERFMERYDPEHMELSTKDVVSRAIYMENKEGRGPIYADLRHIPYELLMKKQPDFMRRLLKTKTDVRKDLIEVRPDAHTMSGGVRINEKGESSIPGLYAAGCAAGGVHGGNRIGGSGTITALVFGRRAGISASERAKGIGMPRLDKKQIEREEKRVFKPLERVGKGVRPIEVKNKIKEQMWTNVGISKDEKGMLEALKEFRRIRERGLPRLAPTTDTTGFNYEWVEALEVPNMLDLAEMVTTASLMRKESRHNFSRDDYPKSDDENWLKNIVLRRENGVMKIWTEPVELLFIKP